ncbi:YidB family protein [Candidatus Dormiibacter inghamiae]|uniref:YidB family protein n=1 Tax=Candidatus Dormiibacter inghamiae TaxID=3127013 RepID=UPI0030C6C21A
MARCPGGLGRERRKRHGGSARRRRGRGALQGLVDKCSEAGLEDKARSWVSSGENQPLQPDEIERMLGGEKIEALAQQAGQPPEDVKAALAQALPHVVNVLTPEGKIPDDTQLAALGDRLARGGQSGGG